VSLSLRSTSPAGGNIRAVLPGATCHVPPVAYCCVQCARVLCSRVQDVAYRVPHTAFRVQHVPHWVPRAAYNCRVRAATYGMPRTAGRIRPAVYGILTTAFGVRLAAYGIPPDVYRVPRTVSPRNTYHVQRTACRVQCSTHRAVCCATAAAYRHDEYGLQFTAFHVRPAAYGLPRMACRARLAVYGILRTV
jgi:hypothetical protein